MLFLYRLFCGFLQVEFWGVYPEKVLNLCAKNGITVWSGRYSKGKIYCNILVKDFLKLPDVLKSSGVRVHIIKKVGFPFFIKKYEKRFGVFAGIVIFFAFLQIMSGYIWIIDVVGNKTVSDEKIISTCFDLGIKTGIKKSEIDSKNDVQDLLLKSKDLAWASLNIEGSKLTVNVSEITAKKEDNSVATNLKSSHDAIIKRIDVTSGNCVVKVGDTVAKGEILVSGIIENANGTKFVHSIGTIIAETQETIIIKESFTKKKYIPNGKVKQKSVLDVFGIKLPLYFGKEKGNFETASNKKTLKLFSKELPIKVYTKKFIFQDEIIQEYSYEQLCDKLEKQLEETYKNNIKSVNFSQTEKEVILSAIISETKNIAISENFILDIGI